MVNFRCTTCSHYLFIYNCISFFIFFFTLFHLLFIFHEINFNYLALSRNSKNMIDTISDQLFQIIVSKIPPIAGVENISIPKMPTKMH